MKSVARNEPCPCGSGSKYKNCCLPNDMQAQTDSDDVSHIKATAFKKMSDRQWDEAIQDFKSILDKTHQPSNIHEAIAACYDGQEDYLMAAEFFEKALVSCPPLRRADNRYRLGVARGCAGRCKKAKSSLSGMPDIDEGAEPGASPSGRHRPPGGVGEDYGLQFLSYSVCGTKVVLQELEAEDYGSACRRLEGLLRLAPDNASVLYNLGVCYSFLKRDDEALAV